MHYNMQPYPVDTSQVHMHFSQYFLEWCDSEEEGLLQLF